MNERVIAGTLRRCDLLSAFEVASLTKLAQFVETHTFDPREAIFKSGDPGSSMFIIATGKVQFHIDVDGRDSVVGDLGPVSSFGELSLLLPADRFVSAQAEEEVTAYEFTHGSLKMLQHSDPELALELIMALRERCRGTMSECNVLIRRLFVESVRTSMGKK